MKTYIGIDVAKLHLDIHQDGKASRIPNNEKSITGFLKSLSEHSMIVCESSGGFGNWGSGFIFIQNSSPLGPTPVN